MRNTRSILIFEDKSHSLELRVNPKEITVSDSVANIKEELDGLGEVILPGKRGLKGVSFQTFIPANGSPLRGGKSVKEVQALFERWLSKETKLRIIITKPKINFKALLNSVSFSLREGDKDMYISAGFTEYKDILVSKAETTKGLIHVGNVQGGMVALSERSDERPAGQTEVVKKGTTLWALAVKHYGKGEDWRKIAKANGIQDPKKLKEGMVLQIP